MSGDSGVISHLRLHTDCYRVCASAPRRAVWARASLLGSFGLIKQDVLIEGLDVIGMGLVGVFVT